MEKIIKQIVKNTKKNEIMIEDVVYQLLLICNEKTHTAIEVKQEEIVENVNENNVSKFREKARQAHKLRRFIKATNVIDNNVYYFKSKYQAAKYVGCSPARVYLICEGKRGSKMFNYTYKFSYVDDVEDDKFTIIKDAKIGMKYKKKEKNENKENL